MSAMDLGFTSDGTINDQIIDFYVERAKGGVGFIVVGGCYPEMNGKVWKSIIGLDKDELIPGLKKLTDAIHVYTSAWQHNYSMVAEAPRLFLQRCNLLHPPR